MHQEITHLPQGTKRLRVPHNSHKAPVGYVHSPSPPPVYPRRLCAPPLHQHVPGGYVPPPSHVHQKTVLTPTHPPTCTSVIPRCGFRRPASYSNGCSRPHRRLRTGAHHPRHAAPHRRRPGGGVARRVVSLGGGGRVRGPSPAPDLDLYTLASCLRERPVVRLWSGVLESGWWRLVAVGG